MLAANDFFSNRARIPIQALRYNQFGAAGGGPIKKNRAFFFFAYEGLREVIPIQATTSVPTPLQRAGDFSQTLNTSGQVITIYDPRQRNPTRTTPDNICDLRSRETKFPTSIPLRQRSKPTIRRRTSRAFRTQA